MSNKLERTLFYVLIIFLCCFSITLRDGTFSINRISDLIAEKEQVKEEVASKYQLIGIYQATEEYNKQLKLKETFYDLIIDDKNNRIKELEEYISSDYENYAYYFYQMTEDQFLEFCAVVQAEGKTYRNQIAITQTAINLALAFGNTPYYWMCQSGAYTTPEETVWKSTKENVMAVFLDGARVTSRPIKYFYSYTMMPEGSKWHESQIYVMTIDDHNFYE